MGQVLTLVGKRSRHASVEHRIEKINSKSKPDMHPLYPTERKILDRIRSEHPELTAKIQGRQLELEQKVNSLRIVSSAAQSRTRLNENSSQFLPRHRSLNVEPENGFYEPEETATPGKIRFRRFVELMQTSHDEKSSGSTLDEEIRKLAAELDLHVDKLKTIINYYAPFERSLGYEVLTPMDMTHYVRAGPKETPQFKREFLESILSLEAHGKELYEIQRRQMLKSLSEHEEAKKLKEIESGNDEKIRSKDS